MEVLKKSASYVLPSRGNRLTYLSLLLAGIFCVFLFAYAPTPASSLTTVPTKMNFQGRLADSAGNIKANGTYNMRLKLYTVGTGGSAVWSEDRLVSATQGVTVTNGTFSIQLGSITTLPASLFASGALYLEVELPTPATATSASPTWTEGPMTPRNQMATSAYAYNAETLDGIDSDSFAQLATNNTYTGTNTFNVLGTNAFRIQNGSAVDVFKVDTTSQTVTVGGGPGTSIARVHIEGQASTSAMVWTGRSAAEANTWNSITYGNGLYVAVAESGTNRVMTSPDGITWTARTAPEANGWGSVTYGNGIFVAVAYDGTNRVMTSPDGITWTSRSAAQANWWTSVTYGNGLFVAVSDGGTNRVMTSPDGITWTARTASEANAWSAVTYGNNQFVAVAYGGTNRVMTSPDGITWTARAADASSWKAVTYGNSLFVAVANSGTNRVMTSPDGITWTARTASAANSWLSVTYGNGLFVAVSASGTNRVMTSPDGITWTARTASEANNWYSVTFGRGQFVAVSNSGTNLVMTSSDIALTTRGAVQITGELSASVLQATSLDTATATVLTIGANNATSVTIAKDTTIAAGKTVTIVGGTTSTRPASPVEGMLFYDQTTDQMLTYANGKWQADRSTATKIVAASNSSQAAKDAADYVADGNTAAAADGDQVQINAALTAAAGGKVYLMEGTYIVDATILIPNNTTFAGAGKGSVIEFGQINVTDAMIENSDTTTGTGVTIRDMFLNGRRDINTVASQYGIQFNGMGGGSGASARPGGRIENVVANNFRNQGIALWTSKYNTISNNTTSNNFDVGIALSGATDNVIDSNIFNGDFIGIYLGSGSNNNTISKNLVSNTIAESISFDGSNNNTITSNTVSNSGGVGISVFYANSNTFTSNTVRNSANEGIYVLGFSTTLGLNNIVSGNTFENNGGSTTNNAIYLNTADSNTIIGNTISDSSATTNNFAIRILNATSDTNYLADNILNGGSINDSGTGTIYASQLNSSGQFINRSTGGFAIQGTAGTNLISTTGTASVTIGTGDTTGTILVLDTKTDAGDPTGTAGGMYYNSSAGKFRCYEGSAWADCVANTNNFAQLAANNTYTGTNTFNVLGTNAFSIQNGSGIDVFKVNTSNQTVTVGGGPGTSPARVHIEAATTSAGMTWVARRSAANNEWRGVTYGNGLFVAVAMTGTGNRVMTSPDGITWTARTSAADNQWRSVVYGNGLFVAVGISGTGNRVMTSPDGITWTARTSAADNFWESVTYGNGLFVAVAQTGTGNRVMTSPDGITWTARTSAADNAWLSVTYGNGLFVAVSLSGTGNRVMTSPDGITWTTRTSAADNQWRSVTYGNGLFVAIADSGTGNRVMTSPDGITWTVRVSASDSPWRAITSSDGLFVAVGWSGSGSQVMTSTDGITWTSRSSITTSDWQAVTYANDLFVAVGNQGNGFRVMTSSAIALTTRGSLEITGNVSSTGGFNTTGDLNVSGTSLFKNTTNGTFAFTIQNASGQSQLTVDTLNGATLLNTSSATASLSLQGGLSTIQLPTPAQPTVTNIGTAGTTSYTYAVSALDGTGETQLSTVSTTTTGNATLNSTNYNKVTWAQVRGAVQYRIYRTASGGTPATTGIVGTVTGGTTVSFDDTGAAGVSYTPSTNTTGGVTLKGGLQVQNNSNVTLGGISNEGVVSAQYIQFITNAGANTGTLGYDSNSNFRVGVLNGGGGSGNIAIGESAGQTSSGTSNSVMIGKYAGSSTGNNNTAVGYGSGGGTTGGYNTSIGTGAGGNITTGSSNSFLGNNAGNAEMNGGYDDNVWRSGQTIQRSTAIGAYAQVMASDSIVLGSVGNGTKVGIGITVPTNILSVSPVVLNNSIVAGYVQASQSGTTVTASSAQFSASNVGEILMWSDGTQTTITGYTSSTVVTVASSATRAASYFRTHKVGFQVASSGFVGIGTLNPGANLDVKTAVNATTAFRIQNSSGVNLMVADTVNMKVTVRSLEVEYNLTVNGHIISGGSTPTIAAGVAACTTPTIAISGTDTAGTITVTTGIGCAGTGKLATVTFNTAFANAPRVTLTPATSNAVGLGSYIDSSTVSTTDFDLGIITSTPTNSTTYKWNYLVIQ